MRDLSNGVLEETRVHAGVCGDDALDGESAGGGRRRHARRPGQLLAVPQPRQRRRRNAARVTRQLQRRAFARYHEARRHLAQLRRSCTHTHTRARAHRFVCVSSGDFSADFLRLGILECILSIVGV